MSNKRPFTGVESSPHGNATYSMLESETRMPASVQCSPSHLHAPLCGRLSAGWPRPSDTALPSSRLHKDDPCCNEQHEKQRRGAEGVTWDSRMSLDAQAQQRTLNSTHTSCIQAELEARGGGGASLGIELVTMTQRKDTHRNCRCKAGDRRRAQRRQSCRPEPRRWPEPAPRRHARTRP